MTRFLFCRILYAGASHLSSPILSLFSSSLILLFNYIPLSSIHHMLAIYLVLLIFSIRESITYLKILSKTFFSNFCLLSRKDSWNMHAMDLQRPTSTASLLLCLFTSSFSLRRCRPMCILSYSNSLSLSLTSFHPIFLR